MSHQEKITFQDIEHEALEEYRAFLARQGETEPSVNFDHPLDPSFRSRLVEFSKIGARIYPEITPKDLGEDETVLSYLLSNLGIPNATSVNQTVTVALKSYGPNLNHDIALALVNQDSTIRELAHQLDKIVTQHPVFKVDPELHGTVHLEGMKVWGRSANVIDVKLHEVVCVIHLKAELKFELIVYTPMTNGAPADPRPEAV